MKKLVLVIAATLTACNSPTTFEKWTEEQRKACWNYHGRLAVDKEAQFVECVAQPFARYPRVLWKKHFKD